MGHRGKWIGWGLVALWLCSSAACADTLTGRVVGVDAPEKKQPFGERSKENLSRLLLGKDVEVQWHKRDAISASSGR